MSITVAGNTVILTPAAGPTANVANVATGTNTFHLLNTGGGGASPTVYAYVGIFKTYAEAIAMDHPTAGATEGGGLPLSPNESMTVQGNFGINPNPGTVYVAAITNVGSTTVFATPVAPGST
jgi:hypothetical protein